MKTKKKNLQFILLLLSLFLIIAIFYLSWLPDGRLGKESFLPLWLLNWSNTYFNIRTAIPFTALSFLLEAWHSITVPSWIKKGKNPFWVWNLAFATILVCLAELGQFFLSRRHPDFEDVLYGVLGSLLGCMLYYVLDIFIQSVGVKKREII